MKQPTVITKPELWVVRINKKDIPDHLDSILAEATEEAKKSKSKVMELVIVTVEEDDEPPY